MKKTAVVIYKSEQVRLLPDLIASRAGEACEVIACGADIEYLLEARGVAYRSAKEFLTLHPYERLRMAREMSETIMHDEVLGFFSHDGISLGRLYMPSLFYYLTTFLYYFDIASGALKGYDAAVTWVSTGKDNPSLATLERLTARALADGMRMVCNEEGREYAEIPVEEPDARLRGALFALTRTAFGTAMRVLNALVSMAPRKPIRIIASDYWRNISSLMRELPESELVLLDRAESREVGLRGIWRHRMRFQHAESFLSLGARRAAADAPQRFAEGWEKAREGHAPFMRAHFKGYSLTPVLETVMRRFIERSGKVVANIDGARAMLSALKPDLVMVRASVSAQTHFAVLCEVARQLGIPSLEVQHGIFSVGPETETVFRSAEYIADYGPLEQKIWREHTYAARSTFIDVGSPRFDPYIEKGVTREPAADGRFKILHIAPPWFPGSWNDSWDLVTYFETFAAAVRDIPHVHVTVKLRAGPAGSEFYREAIRRAFGDIPYSIAQKESLADVLPDADLVVTCHSTAILESLLAHRPTVLDASLPVYTRLARNDFVPHRAEGAFLVAESPDELRTMVAGLASDPASRRALAERGRRFMAAHYLFEDGKSSVRLADAIRALVGARRER